jgi:RNA polymerase subunit RPABC4/transcription elongation factor Spt4
MCERFKVCSNCKVIKPPKAFPYHIKAKGTRKNICKQCDSAQIYRKWIEKQLEAYPDKYTDCDCDLIYNRFKHELCPNCGKENKV